jgi:PAS domain S-box-containing protein
MEGWERRALVEGLMAIVLLALIGLLTLLLYRVFAQNMANQTARMRAQEENARIFNSISDAVYRVDRAWRFTYVNAQGEKLFERSREQMEGRDMWSLFPALRNTLTPNEFERALNSGQATDFECHYPPTESWFHVKAYPDSHGLTVYLQDITARKQQELKVREQEHMDSLGKLTGGVAHDFNNLLTVIMGNTELLAEAVKHDPRLHSLTNVTLEATEKGAKLVSQLLAYARRQPLNPDKVDVNQLVTQMKGLLETAVGGTVAIDYELDATLHRALIDAGRLQDALINLCVNARDAMPQGGIIQIRTRNATLTPDTLPNAQPGQYVAVEVEDGGTGMDAQTLERVFEPFFTTKEVGRGSGLGLAMVHGFISQSKGFIDIDSELGRGTRVTLYMPVA